MVCFAKSIQLLNYTSHSHNHRQHVSHHQHVNHRQDVKADRMRPAAALHPGCCGTAAIGPSSAPMTTATVLQYHGTMVLRHSDTMVLYDYGTAVLRYSC